MAAIFKRELKSYFHTMLGPIFIAAILVFVGIYFTAYNMVQGYPYFSVTLSGVSIILLLVVPVITMRSFAEEKRSKTDQMLLTSPLPVTHIVLGKYFSMIAVLGIAMLITCLCPLIMHFYGGAALLADYVTIFAFFLLGSAYIAIGMFVSSLTESQVLAAVGTFCILLVLQLIDGVASLLPGSALASYVCLFACIVLIAFLLYAMVKNIFISGIFGLICIIALTILFFAKKTLLEGFFPDMIASLSLISRFDTIINQALDVSALIYYVSICVVFVFLTVQTIQKRRWS